MILRFARRAQLRSRLANPKRDRPARFERPNLSDETIVNREEYEKLTLEYRQHALASFPGDVWSDRKGSGMGLTDIDLRNFRSDNAFVWQSREASAAEYALAALWAMHTDSYGLLDQFGEDGSFGVECIRLANRLWSRDVIDSVLEISFMRDQMPGRSLEGLTIVDVGSGYGRLLSRLAQSTKSTRLVGVDGIAVSTALARAYIGHLQLSDRVNVLSLSEADQWEGPIDIAVNVHSFSEMSADAVNWWLEWVRVRGASHLFVVPNRPGPSFNSGASLAPLISGAGFQLVTERDKYTDSLVALNAPYSSVYYWYRRIN